jgi:hypothetical protein
MTGESVAGLGEWLPDTGVIDPEHAVTTSANSPAMTTRLLEALVTRCMRTNTNRRSNSGR